MRRPDDRSAPDTETGTDAGTEAGAWWCQATLYQVYVRSFADSDDDGIGDLEGVRSRLGYLELLGVDGLWLTPFFRSPMVDHGYDVSDARDVDPLFGDLRAFDRLVEEAHAHGLRLIIDLVPSRTSEQHEWFQAALAAEPGSQERNRYIFRDGTGPDGDEPPNNWTSTFGGPAWTRLAPSSEGSAADAGAQWYLHLSAPGQPDLNWQNPEVTADLERTLRFWLDRGVDGFHVGTTTETAKQAVFDADTAHNVHRVIRKVLEEYPGRISVGEIGIAGADAFDGGVLPDETHLGVNFRLLTADFDAAGIRDAIEHSLAAVQNSPAPASWTLSSHDVPRPVTRYGDGEVGLLRARAMALVLLALPGPVYLYNGEELGLPNVDLPDWALQDPIWERSGHTERGRDGSRVPMPWEGKSAPYGFSRTPGTWLPMPGDWANRTVEAQLENPDSTLSLYRQALELRRKHPAFAGTELEWYGPPPGCFAFRRKNSGLVCALNTSQASVALPPGEVLLLSGPIPPDTEILPPNTAAWLVSTVPA